MKFRRSRSRVYLMRGPESPDSSFAYDSTINTEAPGFGLPLNYHPDDQGIDGLFPSALSPKDMCAGRTTLALTTLNEITMLQLMNQITDKPDWYIEVFDESTSQQWRQDAVESNIPYLSSSMLDWVIDELRYKAQIFEDTEAVSIYTGDVIKSDLALPEAFKLELQAAVQSLEDVQGQDKDWHPATNEQVRDLVHPSLFPLVYGRTRVLETGTTTLKNCISMCGEGVTIPVPPEDESSEIPLENKIYNIVKNPYSRKFQWLPCEIDIAGDSARIKTYINNLHPERHEDLYSLVEQAVNAAIPLWNMTLAPTIDSQWGTRIDDYHGTHRNIVQPEPGKFVPPVNPPYLNLRQTFGWQGLQVIVKLANIELTPEKPKYSAGSWYAQDQLNEHICATALYYYSNENVEDGTLYFRQQSNPLSAKAVHHDEGFVDWLPEVYGCDINDSSVQYVGGVETREGRLVTFPNILQHQFQSFGLKDPTKPGHCKVLALFLVDPHIRILSTANVPPQQKEWWIEYLNGTKNGLDKLPQELRDEVFERVGDDFPFGLAEAKALRLELMRERNGLGVRHTNAFKSLDFSLL